MYLLTYSYGNIGGELNYLSEATRVHRRVRHNCCDARQKATFSAAKNC